MERKGKTPESHRLSHFVAPLYVAPSQTPSYATPKASIIPAGSGDSRCQNETIPGDTQKETVPEEGKSHRALTILVNCIENDF